MANTNVTDQAPRLSVSTWSLHRQLGRPDCYGPENGKQLPAETHGSGEISLLEVPARVAALIPRAWLPWLGSFRSTL